MNTGEVEIVLSGTRQTLRCTVRAARTVSAISGGFVAAYQRLRDYDMATYVTIVAAGLDARGDAANKIEERVYETGLDSLTAPLTKYVGLLMNGGREPASTSEGDSGKE